MKLTEKQESRIGRYLDEVAVQLRTLPDDEQKRVLARIRARIREELRQFTARPPDDHDVEMVLKACGNPASAAAHHGARAPVTRVTAEPREPMAPTRPARPRPWSLDPSAGRFLGVCAGLAREFDLEPRAVRTFVILLGLFTGPLTVLAYLGAFAFMYTRTDPERSPAVAYKALAGTLIFHFAVGLTIFVGMRILLWVTAFTYQEYLDGSIMALGREWNWVMEKGSGTFFWALLVCLPLAALSALPVPAAWSGTLRKLAQTVLALYALYLAWGVAFLLTGIVIDLAGQIGGQDIGELIRNLIY